jgi:hypothetical protein
MIIMLKFILFLICFTSTFIILFLTWLFYDSLFYSYSFSCLLPFPVIAAFHTIFSHYSPPCPKGSTWPYWDWFSHRYPISHFSCLSPPPVFYSFIFLIFTVGLFGIYLSSFILIFSSFAVILFHICFSNCLSCLLSRYSQQLYVVCIHPSLTLLAVITSHVSLPRRTCQNLC